MAEVKIELKIGSFEFKGEGDKEWLSQQLDKILEIAPSLLVEIPSASASDSFGGKPASPPSPDADQIIAKQPLATYLKSINATTVQVKKFLACAIWLHAKGNNRLTTGDVNKALKDANQTRLGNAADSLNKNVKKGYCEKDGDNFFVTDEGKSSV